ncbi:protein translocase subunit SecD [Guggenheimella bovis]
MSGRNKALLLGTILLIALITLGTFLGFGPIKAWVNSLNLGLDIEGGVAVVYEGVKTDKMTDQEFTKAVDETLSVLSRRINSFGLTEPNITKEGTKRIRIELPGTKDITKAVEMIGKTATLEFYQVDENIETPPVENAVISEKGGKKVFTFGNKEFPFNAKLLFKGNELKNAGVGTQEGLNVVTFELTDNGTKIFSESSKEIVEKYKARRGQIVIVLDNEIISAPYVDQVLTDSNLVIRGNYTADEAILLSNLIKGGALPIQLKEVQTNLINATLGQNALQKAVLAGIIGFGLIFVFMVLRYRLGGFIATIALLLYGSLTFLVLMLFNATLTLPGIAGMVLSIGMAVDANVIILERLREELGFGKTLRSAVKASYHRAMSAIVDSNITTLVAGIILYIFGEGSVKGFAITLSVGVALSMFTAILVTQFMMNLLAGIPGLDNRNLYGFKNPEKETFNFDFMKNAKYFIILSIVLIGIGMGALVMHGFDYGIDFTGGTILNIAMDKEVNPQEVQDTIAQFKLDPTIITSGDGSNVLSIKTKEALDAKMRDDVFGALQKKYNLKTEAFLGGSQFGPAIGSEIGQQAIIAIVIATIAMLLYVTLRFQFNFGVSAVVALVHDTLMLLAIYAFFKVTVNSSFIAAVLTVVGYSINDTIVIFDKVRENLKLMRGETNAAIINRSINQTLTRTLFTALTTFFVILTLYIFGVDSIREFAFPLLWGTIVGSYSTLFIAGPLWVYLSRKKKS